MILKKFTKNFYIEIIFIIFIFLFDRFSKIYVINFYKKNNTSELFESKFLNINLIWNEGIAFGLFSFDKSNLYNILTLIIFLVIFTVLLMIIKSEGIKRYSLLMIFGGALGNFYDRVIYKAVPDFIDLHIAEFHWFIFNVADIFITIGVIFMILYELFGNNKDHNEQF
jgi:signal peptidase II